MHCIKCGQAGHLSIGCRGLRKPSDQMEHVDLAVQTVPPPSQAEGNSNMEELLHQRIKQLEATEATSQ